MPLLIRGKKKYLVALEKHLHKEHGKTKGHTTIIDGVAYKKKKKSDKIYIENYY